MIFLLFCLRKGATRRRSGFINAKYSMLIWPPLRIHRPTLRHVKEGATWPSFIYGRSRVNILLYRFVGFFFWLSRKAIHIAFVIRRGIYAPRNSAVSGSRATIRVITTRMFLFFSVHPFQSPINLVTGCALTRLLIPSA